MVKISKDTVKVELTIKYTNGKSARTTQLFDPETLKFIMPEVLETRIMLRQMFESIEKQPRRELSEFEVRTFFTDGEEYGSRKLVKFDFPHLIERMEDADFATIFTDLYHRTLQLHERG